MPYTGGQKADNILAKYMGRMVEYYVPGIVESELYKQLNNPQKEILLKEELKNEAQQEFMLMEKTKNYLIKLNLGKLTRLKGY